MLVQMADLVDAHESVSRQHAAVLHSSKNTFLQDLGSAQGTQC
jgi:pSer/pThr/pTyr-binding forkhead associated (FHA) protein